MSGSPVFWTQDRIIEAVHEWVRTHDEPPTTGAWADAGYGHPKALTVWRAFKPTPFADVIRLAGYEPLRRGPRVFWTKDRVAAALLDQLLRDGRWPEQRDWERSGGEAHPTMHLVDRLFGNFANAKLYAGWRPQCPVCQGTFKPQRASHLYCSSACCQRAQSRRRSGLPISDIETVVGCAGCGCDLDVYALGCDQCNDRRRRRLRRQVSKNGASVSVVELLPIGDSDASQPGRVLAPGRAVDFTTEKAAQAA